METQVKEYSINYLRSISQGVRKRYNCNNPCNVFNGIKAINVFFSGFTSSL